MSSFYGDNLKLSIFGQSHASAIGMTLDGIPAGLAVDMEKLHAFLQRRAPGNHDYATTRKETDEPVFLCGIVDGFTSGAPITAIIYNQNTRSQDYSAIKDLPRPGHADYVADVKYGGFQDVAGGGHFSGRLTAPMCIAGGLCKQWLEDMGIRICAHIATIGGVKDASFDPVTPEIDSVDTAFPVINAAAADKMRECIANAKAEGDSVGGIIECAVTGLPVGLGEPLFAGMESRIATIVYGIPAVKGLEFGSGFSGSTLRGSQNNDAYCIQDGCICTATNHAGGILGGITTGMPLLFRAAIKPTPSIALPQQSVRLSTMEAETLMINGRHDPCIVPRAVPVVEAAAAIAIYDAILGRTEANGRK